MGHVHNLLPLSSLTPPPKVAGNTLFLLLPAKTKQKVFNLIENGVVNLTQAVDT